MKNKAGWREHRCNYTFSEYNHGIWLYLNKNRMAKAMNLWVTLWFHLRGRLAFIHLVSPIASPIVLTNEARFHSSVIVVGEGIENAAALHLKGLVYDPFDDLQDLIVAEFVACITWMSEMERAS